MPLIKCSKCGKEYDSLYFDLHSCKNAESVSKEGPKYWKASGLRGVFLFHPDASFVIRAIVFLRLFAAIAIILSGILLYFADEFTMKESLFFVLVGIANFLIAAALAHLKKWAIYIMIATLLIIIFTTKIFALTAIDLLTTFAIIKNYKKFT